MLSPETPTGHQDHRVILSQEGTSTGFVPRTSVDERFPLSVITGPSTDLRCRDGSDEYPRIP